MNNIKLQSNQKQINVSHIRDMVSLAYIDGDLHEKEITAIKKFGIKLGLTPMELEGIFHHPEKIQFHPSINKVEKKEHLLHLIQIIFADSKVAEEEVELYSVIACALGFSEELSQEMLNAYLEEFKTNSSVICKLLLNMPLRS